MIHLIADSTGAVSEDMLASHPNLHVIPLTLSFGGDYIPENKATIEDVISYSEREKKAVATSQPGTGDFLALLKTIPEDDPVIIVTLTSGVSGTYNGAVLAARQSKRKNIAVINSRTTAIGIVEVLEDAFQFIDEGLSFEEVVKKLERAALHMRTTFVPSTLDYLRRGGRIGKAAGLIGAILKIKPVIFLNDQNEVDVLDKVRTQKKANACMLQYLKDHSPCKRVGIVHIENPEGGEALKKEAEAICPGLPITVTTGTPVLAAYLGPGLVGIIFEEAE